MSNLLQDGRRQLLLLGFFLICSLLIDVSGSQHGRHVHRHLTRQRFRFSSSKPLGIHKAKPSHYEERIEYSDDSPDTDTEVDINALLKNEPEKGGVLIDWPQQSQERSAGKSMHLSRNLDGTEKRVANRKAGRGKASKKLATFLPIRFPNEVANRDFEENLVDAPVAVQGVSTVSTFWQYIFITVGSIMALGFAGFLGLVAYEWTRSNQQQQSDAFNEANTGKDSASSALSVASKTCSSSTKTKKKFVTRTKKNTEQSGSSSFMTI